MRITETHIFNTKFMTAIAKHSTKGREPMVTPATDPESEEVAVPLSDSESESRWGGGGGKQCAHHLLCFKA